MKETILNHIISEFGEQDSKRLKHYSYCIFPEGECICKNLNEITSETTLISGGYMDSFAMVSVLVFLEETFKIKIKDIDTIPENFNSVNKMYELVQKYINK